MKTRLMQAVAFAICLGMPAEAMECKDDAMLVFDASGSMAETGHNGPGSTRIAEAREALRKTMPDITPFRQMGLVIYGPGTADACNNIDLRFGPAPDAALAIIAAADRVVPDGNTPLTEAVRQAAGVLGGSGRRGDIVLVTDGRETCHGAPCQLAAELASGGLKVHVIGFRVRGAAFEWQTVGGGDIRNHQTVARCLADRTGGQYVTAESTDDLVAALRDILGCPIVS